jgi:hypothetical protein
MAVPAAAGFGISPGRSENDHAQCAFRTAWNGLKTSCRLMVDKITTVPKSRIGNQIGRLDDEDLVHLNRAVLVFLGFAGSGPEN